MKPTRIKSTGPDQLTITWEDGKETTYSLTQLRDGCPCASCSGETLLLHEYRPAEPDRTVPGRYQLKSIQPVGSYAIQITWGDGHSTGIYTYEYLRRLAG